MTAQFVKCQFGTSKRLYTYRNDGDPYSVGDRVIVGTKTGEQAVTVIEIADSEPPFQCQPVLRLAPAKPQPEDQA